MYNAVKFTACAIACLFMASCSGNNQRAEEAQSLLNEAQYLAEGRDYTGAIAMLDSLDTAFRDCVDLRRQGTLIRIQALIALTEDSIAADEQRRPALQHCLDSLSSQFITVSMQGTAGFRAYKPTFNGAELNSTCIRPRIDERGYFYAVVNLQGQRIGLNSIVMDDIAVSGQSISMEGSEMMSLSQEVIAPLAEAIYYSSASSLTLNLIGSKGRSSIRLSSRDIAAWKSTWYYAKLLQAMETANIRREKYENQLETLSGQLSQLTAKQESAAE